MTKNVMRAIIALLCLAMLALPSQAHSKRKPELTCDGKIAKLHQNEGACR